VTVARKLADRLGQHGPTAPGGPTKGEPLELAFVEVVDGERYADAVHAADGRPVVLLDHRHRPASLRREDGPPPVAVVADDPVLAILHQLHWRCRVWSTGAVETTRRRSPLPSATVVVGAEPRAGSADAGDEDACGMLLGGFDGTILTTGSGAARFADRMRTAGVEARPVENTVEALVDVSSTFVVVLDATEVLPDVAVALGHTTVSSRAPLLCDWRFVPTILGSAAHGSGANTLVDVIADGTFSDWVGSAANAQVLSRVPAAAAPLAFEEAVRHAEFRVLADRYFPGYGAMLGDRSICTELDRLSAAVDARGWWELEREERP